MVTYPIRIPLARTSANRTAKLEIAKRNRVASDLEQKINDLLLRQTAPIKTYSWSEISQATGFPHDLVKDIGFDIDCGSNGFTAWRHDLSLAEALALNDKIKH